MLCYSESEPRPISKNLSFTIVPRKILALGLFSRSPLSGKSINFMFRSFRFATLYVLMATEEQLKNNFFKDVFSQANPGWCLNGLDPLTEFLNYFLNL